MSVTLMHFAGSAHIVRCLGYERVVRDHARSQRVLRFHFDVVSALVLIYGLAEIPRRRRR